MQVQRINNKNNFTPNFGSKFQLSKETIKIIEASTGLTQEEMVSLPLYETEKLMRQRGKLKENNKFKTWVADKYRQIGEALGLLEKKYDIYTDID